MPVKIRMTSSQHQTLMRMVFPGDGREAVAVALCGRASSNGVHVLIVKDVYAAPADAYSTRHSGLVSWSTEFLLPLLERAAREHLGVMKVHSHPGGYAAFSSTDDAADAELFPSIAGWTDDGFPHVSVILLPDGAVVAREVDSDGAFHPVERTTIVGADIVSYGVATTTDAPAFAKRTRQAFGDRTFAMLAPMRVGVVGCSGTGCHVVESLARLGVGTLVLVDPKKIDTHNVSRIIQARMRDVGRAKIDILGAVIRDIGIETQIMPFEKTVIDVDVVRALSTCDVVFGCTDGAEGRYVLNRIASFYSLPYVDVGVHLSADGQGGVDQVCGTVHYLQPGGSSLLSRGVITLEEVRAEGLRRTNPEEYEAQVREGYVRGTRVDRPAVIAINGHYANLAVMEMLARLHPYRSDPNDAYAVNGSSLADGYVYRQPDGEPCAVLARHVGRGDVSPLLDLASLDGSQAAAPSRVARQSGG